MFPKQLVRHPDHCPNHPNDHLVATEYTTTGRGGARLIQHRCGHRGCDQYLGWQFEGSNQPTRSGPTRCQDAAVTRRMAVVRWTNRRKDLTSTPNTSQPPTGGSH